MTPSTPGMTADSRRQRLARLDIIAISLATACCLVGDSFLYIALPLCWQETGLHSLLEVGIILAVNRLVRLPLNPLLTACYGWLTPRQGIFAATFLAILSTAGYAFISGIWGWLLLRVIWGVAWTLLRLGTLYAILTVGSASDKGYLTGLNNGIYRLGSLVGMLGGGVLADLFGFRTAALCFAGITCLAPFIAWFGISDFSYAPARDGSGKAVPVREQHFFLTLWRYLRGNDAWIMGMGFIVAFMYQGVVASSLSALVKDHLGTTFLLFGGLFSCASVSGFFQALRWGWEPFLAPRVGRLSDARGRVSLVRGASVFAMLTILCAAVPKPVMLEFTAVLCLLIGATILTTASDALANDRAISAEKPRIMLSMYAFCGDFGAAVGPLMVYGLMTFFSVNVAWAVSGLCLGLFCVRLFLLKK